MYPVSLYIFEPSDSKPPLLTLMLQDHLQVIRSITFQMLGTVADAIFVLISV
jgi:hypothetical protein